VKNPNEELSQSIRGSSGDFGRFFAGFEKALEPTQSLAAQANKTLAFLNGLFRDVFAQYERDQKIARHGWFPHSCLGLDAISLEIDSNPDTLEIFLNAQIDDNWANIKSALENSEAFVSLGYEHKETMRQCLVAHEAGLYRCVPRTLFAEIEMASRIVLEGVELNNKINAGLKPVLAILGSLPVTLLPDDMRPSAVFELLTDHVYKDSRHQESGYSLPNRHDHMHGYSEQHASFRDSINMLLLAETMFRILAVFAKLKEEQSKESEAGENEC